MRLPFWNTHLEWRPCAVALAVALVLACGLGLPPHPALSQEADLPARWQTLQAQDAAILAPKRFDEAEVAMKLFERDGEPARAEAEKRVLALDVAVRRARTLWGELLGVRDEARAAGAPEVDPQRWRAAENVLAASAQKLEAGRTEAAQRQIGDARPLYEEARWTAERAQVLQGADSIATRLGNEKARTYVPRSYVRTLDAIRAAEDGLRERGIADPAVRAAGDQALREALHASSLLQMIRAACDDRAPDRLESAILEWEDAARRAAQSLGVPADFGRGLGPPLVAIENEAAALRTERDRLRTSTSQRVGVTDTLASQIDLWKERVRERDRRIAALERDAAAYAAVESIQGLFTRDEGRVLIDGRDLILRLHGLQFPSGKAELPPDASPLLDKIVRAMALVPNAAVLVEGHTDDAGTPQENVALSQQRASAVREALAARAGIAASRLQAMGLGSSRPVAANATPEGRALNRRIEVVLARPQ